jgi:hypothetical protein
MTRKGEMETRKKFPPHRVRFVPIGDRLPAKK